MRTVPLQQICGIQIGRTPSRSVPEYWGGDLPWVTIRDFAGGRIVETTTERITEVGAKKSGSKLIPRGTLLLSFKLSLGKRAYAGCDLFTNEAIAALQVRDQEVADRDYLYWALGSIDYDRLVDRAAKGKTLNKAKLKILQIPLPPLAEQKRIAGILDAADALRAKRRESLAQLDTLLQSVFLDMFGDPVTNPMGWEMKYLPDLVSEQRHSLKRGPFGGALKKEIFVQEGFKVYEQKNVIYDDFDTGSYFIKKPDYERLAAFQVKPNDLLISCSGTIGRIATVPVEAAPGVMNQALLKIDLDEARTLNSFFVALWRSQPFARQVLGMTHGTGMKNMKSMNELKGIRFPIPPLDRQHRFAAIAESVEHQKTNQRAHLAELDTLFASLQSRAFRGEL